MLATVRLYSVYEAPITLGYLIKLELFSKFKDT